MNPLRKVIHIYKQIVQFLIPEKPHKKHIATTRKKLAERKAALNDHNPSSQPSSDYESKSKVASPNTSGTKDDPAVKQESPLSAGIKQCETYNVVLAAVSTFNNRDNKITQSRYMYKDEYYGYLSQAEPVIRYISQQLQFSTPTDCIDRLILLCSDEVKEEKTMISPNGTSVSISPLKLLTDQIKNRMNPDISENDYFKTIPINIANPAPAILETIDELRLLQNMHGSALQLFVDTHGGLRSLQQAMDAMLSLVKNEINIKGFYNVIYNNNVAMITLKERADIFDFVSGINEFSNYGRIASLSQYYSDLENTAISEKAERLMAPIQKIAQSIQLCDIPAFEQGLSELKTYYDDLDNASLPNTNEFEEQQKRELSYLALFQNNIRNDYANLLADNRSVSTEVLWCLKKGFYQQALTLIEGRMPEELHAKGIFSYPQSLSDYVEAYRGDFKPNVYIVSRSFPFAAWNALGINKDTLKPTVLGFLHPSAILEDIWNGVSYTNEAHTFISRVRFYNKVPNENVLSGTSNPFRSPLTLCRANASHLFAFFLLHLGFKYLRNTYNHGSDVSPGLSTDDVEQLIGLYLEWERQLETEIR